MSNPSLERRPQGVVWVGRGYQRQHALERPGTERRRVLAQRSRKCRPVLARHHDPQKRLFAAERWHFSGMEAWLDIGRSGDIQALARQRVPTLGTGAFFELG
jgi:hypothetical protein